MTRGVTPPVVVGVTGGLGTGKSTVARMLEEWRGVVVLDADRIAHDVIQPRKVAWRQILERFGKDIVHSHEDVRIDRKRLAELVVEDDDARRDLEAIVHPRVLKELAAEIHELRHDTHGNRRKKMVVVEIPLLFETDSQGLVDHVVVVTATPEVALRRLRERGMTEDDAARRQAAQMDLSAKAALADTVIDNSGDREQTRRQVETLWDQLVNIPRSKPRG
jgi:dephospho-CoA kinase